MTTTFDIDLPPCISDTSRNYFPVSDILRTIDAMAYNKMNVCIQVMHRLFTDSMCRYSIGTLLIHKAFLYDWMVFLNLLNKVLMCSTIVDWSIPKRTLIVLWNMQDPGVFVSFQKLTW